MTRREKLLIALLFALLPAAGLSGYALAQCPEDVVVECEVCPDCPEPAPCPPATEAECDELYPEAECPGRKVKVRCVDPSPEPTLHGDPLPVIPPDEHHIDLMLAVREYGYQTGVTWNWNVSRRVRPVVTFSSDWDETHGQSCSAGLEYLQRTPPWYEPPGDYSVPEVNLSCTPYKARPRSTWGVGVVVGLFRK
jgi:hypothetical protein